MPWQSASAQNLGGRSNQEDAVGIIALANGATLVALADGAGGHQRGEVASNAAIAEITKEAARLAPGDIPSNLGAMIEKANRAVMALGRTEEDTPRTTLVLGYLAGNQIAWAHVGDSRLYHVRGGKLLGRSHDDSVVQLLVDMGRVSEAEALHHPDRNRLLKALGGAEIGDGQPGRRDAKPGDGVLLCSDGVWEHVSIDEIAQAVGTADLAKAARELTALAASRGGRQADNASAILARLG